MLHLEEMRDDQTLPVAPRSLQFRSRRGPRLEEIALLRLLAASPRSVTSGPIGRCVKRGWCRAVIAEDLDEGLARVVVRFALTETGRALIGES